MIYEEIPSPAKVRLASRRECQLLENVVNHRYSKPGHESRVLANWAQGQLEKSLKAA